MQKDLTRKKYFCLLLCLILGSQPLFAMRKMTPLQRKKEMFASTVKKPLSFNDDCLICYEKPTKEDFSHNIFFGSIPNKAVILPCRHLFCFNCLDQWDKSKAIKENLCPACKKEYSLPKKEEYQLAVLQKLFGKNWLGWFVSYFPFTEVHMLASLLSYPLPPSLGLCMYSNSIVVCIAAIALDPMPSLDIYAIITDILIGDNGIETIPTIETLPNTLRSCLSCVDKVSKVHPSRWDRYRDARREAQKDPKQRACLYVRLGLVAAWYIFNAYIVLHKFYVLRYTKI